MTKGLGCEAIVSDEVRATAGLASEALPRQDVEIRGRSEPMCVRVVPSASALATLLKAEEPVAA
jgi:adenylate cyclase